MSIICGGLLGVRQRGAGISLFSSACGAPHVPCSFRSTHSTSRYAVPSRTPPAHMKNPNLVRRGIGSAAHQGNNRARTISPTRTSANSVTIATDIALLACRGFFPDVCSRPNLQHERRGTAMSNRFTRRRFLVTAGATASTVLGSSLFNLETVWAAPVPPQSRRHGRQRSSSGLLSQSHQGHEGPAHFQPAELGLSGCHSCDHAFGSYIAWNTCEHGHTCFWSWHRMYLYWFERIIRKMSGDPGWALPFWDYHRLRSAICRRHSAISGSELFIGSIAVRDGMREQPPSRSHMSILPPAWPRRLFFGQGDIESNPHNNVHVDIGGWMGSSHSCQDPVFLRAPLQH